MLQLFNKLWTPKLSQKVSDRQLYFNARIPLRQNVWMMAMCHAVYTDWLRLTFRRTKRKPQRQNLKD